MENYQKYLDPLTLASLEGLDLQARMVVEGYVAGMHPSPYHGFSVEFAEHREYVPGDDIRHVDWKVWSKTDKLYLKQYEQETNLLTYLLLDTSESMAYASGDNVTKLQYAQLIAASLSYLILQQQDSVGLVIYDDAVRRYLKPAGQTSQLKEILHLLDVTPAREKSDLGLVFNDLAERFKKRGVVVILSDLFDDPARIVTGLKHFRHRRHEVIVFHILDPAELDFPFRDTTLFKGMEGMADILTDPHALKRAYQAELGSFLKELEKGCRMVDIDYVPLAHRSEPGRRVVELPGVPIGSNPLSVSAAPALEELSAVMLPLVWALGFANAPLLYALAAAGGPRRDPSLESAQVPGSPLGGDAVSAGGHPQESAAAPHRAVAAAGDPDAGGSPGRLGDGQAVSESFGAVIAGQRTHKVIVLDGSLSMGYRSGESSRFDQAKAVATQIVKDARGGDAVSVIMMGDPPRVVIGDPTNNLREVEKEIGELAQSDGGTDLAATFEKVDRVLEVSSIVQKEVIFLTDLQAASWRPPAEATDGLNRTVARLEARRPRSVVIDLGKSGGENRAVTDLKLDVPVVTVGDAGLDPRRPCATLAVPAPTVSGRG